MKLLIAILSALSLLAQTASYPGTVVGDSQLKIAGNRIQTVLRGSISASDTVITVASPTNIVANMLLTIDSEIFSVTSVSGNNLTVVRGFDGTTAAAHSSGRTVSVNIAAWHHNSLRAEIKAIETTLGANLANVTTSSGATISTTYNFSAQTPGGSLIVGANVITMTPCPLGVAGTNVNHYLYISGGVGTAESVLISGGSCTSGLSTGTLIFTAANTHSGAWTIKSATAGIREAAAVAGVNGVVSIPPGTHVVYDETRVNDIHFVGTASGGSKIERNFAGTRSVLATTAVATSTVQVMHLEFTVNGAFTPTGGFFLEINTYAESMVRDIKFTGGVHGVLFNNSARASIIGLRSLGFTGSALRCIGSGLVVDDWIASSAGVNAIGFEGKTGLSHMTNVNLQLTDAGSKCMYFNPDAGQQFSESVIGEVILDSCGTGIEFGGAGAVNAMQFSNVRMALGSTSGRIPIWMYSTQGHRENKFSNVVIAGCAHTSGCIRISGGTAIEIENVKISDVANAAGQVIGILLGQTTATVGVKITNCEIGYTSSGTVDADMADAIRIDPTATASVSIIGNRLHGTVTPINNGGSGAGIFMRDNWIEGGSTQPTCNANTRGSTWHTFSAAGVLDKFEICRKDAANAYAWTLLY